MNSFPAKWNAEQANSLRRKITKRPLRVCDVVGLSSRSTRAEVGKRVAIRTEFKPGKIETSSCSRVSIRRRGNRDAVRRCASRCCHNNLSRCSRNRDGRSCAARRVMSSHVIQRLRILLSSRQPAMAVASPPSASLSAEDVPSAAEVVPNEGFDATAGVGDEIGDGDDSGD